MTRDIKEKSKWAWARFGDFNNILDLLDLLGWKTQGVAVLSSLLSFAWLWEPGNRPLAVIAISLVVIGVSSISIAWQVKHGAVKKAEPPTLLSDSEVPAGIDFFANIDELRQRHPLPETFKPGNEIHAYFLSGEGVFAEYNDYIKCVKRLILPTPDAANLATLEALSGSYSDYKTQIPKYRALALKNNVPVRLFQDFIGMSLLFCNPDRQDGWVQVGIIIPGSESRERQHYRLYKGKNEKAFLSLYRTYNRLWEASVTKTDEEEFQSGFAGEPHQ